MNVYAVGGCVRDWVLGAIGAADLDVAVEGDGIALARRVARALQGSVLVHPQFGTATLLHAGGRRIDFAMCRKETYAQPAAYPKVTAGSVRDDLFRRDFTMNAMAVSILPARFGELVDPFGGVADLRAGQLRILHPRSFLDDPSRILRGIRFAQRFGLRWEPATREALQHALSQGALTGLNRGRLQKELGRMSDEPDPAACFEQLAACLEKPPVLQRV
jgi:tRNA nucleotidyltransferase (CCA-adding enzyme)